MGSHSQQRDFAAPNFTQAPNVFFDDLLPEIASMAELKVTLAIIRATFGWHKDEDCLSLSQLQVRTGMVRQSVSDGVNAAIERGFVRRRKVGQAYLYSLGVQILGSPEGGPAASPDSRPVDGSAASPESRPTKETTASKKKEKEIARPEVERLCKLMADLSNERTDPDGKRSKPKYTVTATWRDEMRRLIDIDGRSEELIERAIRWVHEHNFWRKNILGAPKLREKFDTIYLEAQQQGKSGSAGTSKADRVDSTVQALREGSR